MFVVYSAIKKGWCVKKIEQNTFEFSKINLNQNFNCSHFVKELFL